MSFLQISSELPQPPDLKDTLFATAEDWWNNACLNHLNDGWAVYAIGYKDAADILVEYLQAQDHGRQQDFLIYPIVFLYRQYLELALKDLLCQARKFLDDAEPYPQIHNVYKLWGLCDTLLERIFSADSTGGRKQIGRLIQEFAQVDPTSTAFRYPEDTDGNPSLPGLSSINLANVRDMIEKISIILEGANVQIDECLSCKWG